MKNIFLMLLAAVVAGSVSGHTANAAIMNGTDTTNATVNVQSGDLTLSDITGVLIFNPLSGIGSSAATQNNNTIDMTITDYRGTHTGWTLNAQFSDFANQTEPGVFLGANDYINRFEKRSALTKLSGTSVPTLNNTLTSVYTKADGTFPQFELARALGETGAGDVNLRIPANMFELVLNDKTKAGNYTGTLTFNLVNGPAS